MLTANQAEMLRDVLNTRLGLDITPSDLSISWKQTLVQPKNLTVVL